MQRLVGFGVLMAVGLSGCSKPPVVAVAPPPAPVGHVYPVMVDVPPAPHPLPAAKEVEVQQAFNVIALKSSLMVGALSCNQQSQYDAFMNEFQPHILAEQHVMDAYFKKIGGHYGQAREDDFVTLMANNQSVSGIGQGAIFCLNNQAEFQQVLTFKTPTDLDNFVTAQSPEQVAAQANPAVIPAAAVGSGAMATSGTTLKKSKAVTMADAQN